MSKTPLINIKELSVGFKSKSGEMLPVLRSINLALHAGESLGLVGESGSGKSTLSSVIAGNEDYEVEKGTISLSGESLEEIDAEERAHKGIFLSFQYPVEIPGVTVTNFIKTAIMLHEKHKV